MSYQESQNILHSAIIVGVDDEVPTRLEFTLISQEEEQRYAIRAFYTSEFEQWTYAIKKIVPPPLSGGQSDVAPKRTSISEAGFKRRLSEFKADLCRFAAIRSLQAAARRSLEMATRRSLALRGGISTREKEFTEL